MIESSIIEFKVRSIKSSKPNFVSKFEVSKFDTVRYLLELPEFIYSTRKKTHHKTLISLDMCEQRCITHHCLLVSCDISRGMGVVSN